MRSLENIFAEIAGLFVEDKLFALAIAVWIAIVAGLAATHAIRPQQGGIALFLGLAAILVASVRAAVRNRSARPPERSCSKENPPCQRN